MKNLLFASLVLALVGCDSGEISTSADAGPEVEAGVLNNDASPTETPSETEPQPGVELVLHAAEVSADADFGLGEAFEDAQGSVSTITGSQGSEMIVFIVVAHGEIPDGGLKIQATINIAGAEGPSLLRVNQVFLPCTLYGGSSEDKCLLQHLVLEKEDFVNETEQVTLAFDLRFDEKLIAEDLCVFPLRWAREE